MSETIYYIYIIFLCNWGESPSELLLRYSKQTPLNSGQWKNIVGVSNMEDADFYIVLDGYSKILPLDKTIFIKREPCFIRQYTSSYIHNIDWTDTNCGITWWVNKTYDELKNMPYPEKSKEISCIVSSKHIHRLKYVQNILKETPGIELYGRGHVNISNYKGELNYDGNCKLKGLIDYKYSIAIENSEQQNYFTEKIADVFLSWCVPLYKGCPNISQYFPKNSYHSLETININIINKPIDIDALREARNLILDEYNIWEIISKKIKSL